MVQRYTTMAGSMEDDDGHFVEYEDYAALKDERDKLVDAGLNALEESRKVFDDYANLKETAEKALAVLEDYEVRIDGEWGMCRDIDQLYADGIVDDVLPLLKGLLHGN